MRRDWVKSRIWKACGVVLSLCMIVGSVGVVLTGNRSGGLLGNIVAAADTEEHVHKVCNGIDYYGHEGASCTEHSDITWTAWTSSGSMPTKNGNYYLTQDVRLTKEWTLPTGRISICLNGHTITGDTTAYIIYAKNNTTNNSFSMTDCKGTGKITTTHEDGNFLYLPQSPFYMYGGTITGINCYSSPLTASKFCMYGGSITGNTSHWGGGVTVSGTFYMFGGSITNNKASIISYDVSGGQRNYGGGVYVTGDSYLYGGKIADNEAQYGGGIYSNGKIYIYDGFSLTGNSADKYGGIYSNSTYYIAGGIVKDNTAGTESSNIYMGSDNCSYISAELSDTTEIWVTAKGYAYDTKPLVLFTGYKSPPQYVVTKEYTVVEADSEKIHSDNSEYTVAYDAENAAVELTSTIPFAGDRSTYSFSCEINIEDSSWSGVYAASFESALVSNDDKEKGDTVNAVMNITKADDLTDELRGSLELSMADNDNTAVICMDKISVEMTDTTYLGQTTTKSIKKFPYLGMTYTVTIPADMRNGSNYWVYYILNGYVNGADPLTLNKTYVTVSTDLVGTFVIAYTPAAEEETTTAKEQETTTAAEKETTTAAKEQETTTAAEKETTTAKEQETTTAAVEKETTTAAEPTSAASTEGTTTAAATTTTTAASKTTSTTSETTSMTKTQQTTTAANRTTSATIRTTSAANRTIAQTTTAAAGILTADDIPGASVVQIDDTDFAQMGEASESTAKIVDMTGSSGTIPDSEKVAYGTESLTEDVLNDIAKGSSDTISVLASESAAISAQVVNALKDSGKTLSVGIVDDSGKVNAIVTLDSDKLTNATRDFSLKIVADVASESVAKAANSRGISSESYDVIDFSYSGTLPGAFKISVNVADRFTDGTQLALYYNNQTTGQLENQYQLTTVSGGYAEFTIDHCSQYVLVSVDAVGSSIVESTISSPKTGDTARITFWLMLMAAAIFAGFGLQAAKADKNCK